MHGNGLISCSRRKKIENTKNRKFINGKMPCGCKFVLQQKTNILTEPKRNVKNARRRPDYKSGTVFIKSFNYKHTNGCSPNQQQ